MPTALTAGSSKVRYMFEDEGTATDIAGFEMYDQRSNEGIYNMATLIPFAMYLCMFLLLQVGYPLTKKALEQLRAELGR